MRVLRPTAALCALAWFGCGTVEAEREPAPEAAADPIAAGPHDVAVVEVRDLGAIRFELLPELAPRTVDHFEQLAMLGYYDGTRFHRVIPGFMIQGGDPLSKDADPRNDGMGGGTGVPDEFSSVNHARGIVSLARKTGPNSGGSQFFIVHEDSPHLDGKYTVFGRVVEGLDVVDAIAAAEIDTFGRYGPRDRPYPKDMVIESIRIEPSPPAS